MRPFVDERGRDVLTGSAVSEDVSLLKNHQAGFTLPLPKSSCGCPDKDAIRVPSQVDKRTLTVLAQKLKSASDFSEGRIRVVVGSRNGNWYSEDVPSV
jgi:hypothetical protein